LWKNALANLVITAAEPYQNMENEFFTVPVFYHAAVDAKKICERKLLCKGILKLVNVKVFT
jgi:hypothetical protein